MTGTREHLQSFSAAMRAAGINPPEHIIADGKLHRFPTNGRPGDDAGWYVLHVDGVPAGAFGDWRSRAWDKWCASATDASTPAVRARIESARKQAEAERAREHSSAAKRAQAVWEAAAPARADHPYLARKRVRPTATLRELSAEKLGFLLGCAPAVKGQPLEGRVLVAPVAIDGKIASVQFIDEAGRKAFMAGGAVAGAYWKAGDLPAHDSEGAIILVGEGIATVLSAAEATGGIAVAALSANNLPAAAEALRARLPRARLVLLADLDAGGLGLAKAREAAAAVGGLLALPEFGENRPGRTKDFNDLAVHRGLDAVRAAIDVARPAGPKEAPRERAPVSCAWPAPPRPIIRIVKGELPRAVDEAERAMRSAGILFFERGGLIVRPIVESVPAADGRRTVSHRFTIVDVPGIREGMMRSADFDRWDGRAKSYVPVDCPKYLAETYASRDGLRRLRKIRGITRVPILRDDGSLFSRFDYDHKSCLFYVPGIEPIPQIPARLSRDDAVAAAALLRNELLDGFPFRGKVDRSVAMSGLVTSVVRSVLPTAPLHAVGAPVQGSGKSYLVDIASCVATGHAAQTIYQPQKEDEFAKRVETALIKGDIFCSLDNCTRPLDGAWLAATISQTRNRIRLLGTNKDVEVENATMLWATGNELELGGDMTRRTLMCLIDPMVERPELRTFDSRPVELVKRNRPRYLAAVFTIVCAYLRAGQPDKLPPVASFEKWGDIVRSALVWAGEYDPVDSMETSRAADVGIAHARAVLLQWESVIGTRLVPVREVIKLANEQMIAGDGTRPAYPGFHSALLEVCSDQRGQLNARKLGWRLRRYKDRVIAGLRLVQEPGDDLARWRLERVSGSTPS